jgi:hypothetical protein
MKKSAFPAALLLLGVFVSGCPVYDDDGCDRDRDCAYGSVCDEHTGRCVDQSSSDDPTPAGIACHRPLDCDANETCSHSGICKAGDCHFESVGCVRGYECSSASGRWECVKPESGSAGNGGSGGDAAAAGSSGQGAASSSSGGAGGAD